MRRLGITLAALWWSASALADARSEALARAQAHDDADAIAELRALLRESPRDVTLLVALGGAELRTRATAAALDHLRQAIALDPRHLEAGIRLVDALRQRVDEVGMLGKLGLARELHARLDALVAAHPESTQARESLMLFHVAAPGFIGGDGDEARRQIDAILRIDRVRGLAAQAWRLKQKGRDAEALAKMAEAVAAGGDAESRCDLGMWLAEAGRDGEALAAYLAVLDREPRHATALYQAGRLAVKTRAQLASGEAALRQYLVVGPQADEDPPRTAALLQLGRLYELAERPDEARAHYVAALKADPASADARAALERLQ